VARLRPFQMFAGRFQTESDLAHPAELKAAHRAAHVVLRGPYFADGPGNRNSRSCRAGWSCGSSSHGLAVNTLIEGS